MTFGRGQIDETPFAEYVDVAAVGQREFLHVLAHRPASGGR